MKKQILTCLFLLMVVAPVSAAQYFCAQEERGQSSYSIYDTKTDCSVWKDSFFSKETYADCMQSLAESKALYNSGKCVPIEEKKLELDGCHCSVGIVTSRNKLISQGCYGAESCNVESAMKKLRQMYGEL